MYKYKLFMSILSSECVSEQTPALQPSRLQEKPEVLSQQQTLVWPEIFCSKYKCSSSEGIFIGWKIE